MVQNQQAAAKKQAEEEKKRREEEEKERERERRRTDVNYNPLLQNGVTNKDVSIAVPQWCAVS